MSHAPLLAPLFDIIYGYCYNVRVFGGENTVESCWNVCKLSSSLSWLEVRNCVGVCCYCMRDVVNSI